jgi:hypothetical protein
VHTISDKCLGKALISKDTSNKILEKGGLTSADKARFLLNNIEATVTRKPELFDTVVTILRKDKSNEHIADALTTEVQDLKNREGPNPAVSRKRQACLQLS